MRRLVVGLFLAGVCLAPGAALAVSDADFESVATRNLLNLCTVSADDPRHREAIHFCHGYIVGAYDYHIADSEKDAYERGREEGSQEGTARK